MIELYLTPASIAYLSQAILALVIASYFLIRIRRRIIDQASPHFKFFIGIYSSITILCFLLFLDTASLPTQRLVAVYFQNTALALLLLFLIQFAYCFPTPDPKQKTEARIALMVSLVYLAFEAGIAIWRFNLLEQDHLVEYRAAFMDYFPPVEIAWVVLIFIRKALENRNNPFFRGFALIILIPLWLVVINNIHISREFQQINFSIGILLTTFLFALNYAASLPEITSFGVKISGAFIIGMLASLSAIAWFITPAFANTFTPDLVDHRTLMFSPNPEGGYEVSEIPFQFDDDLGTKSEISTQETDISTVEISFEMPFFGKSYSSIYVMEDGALSFGSFQRARDIQYNFSPRAMFFLLYMDLDASANGTDGVYYRLDDSQLLLTWYNLSVHRYPEQTVTLQAVLSGDGTILVTYNGFPDLAYEALGTPGELVWVVGVKPDLQNPISADFSQLPLTVPANGALQDEFKNFRSFLHTLMLPLATSILVSSIILLLLLPFLVDRMLTHPLQRLLIGVQAFNRERHRTDLPVQFYDEIGYLTESFNTLTAELETRITDLEDRVAGRTSELVKVNEQLRKLTTAIEQSPSSIVITDLNANIEYANPGFCHLTGYSLDEVVGKNTRILKSGKTDPKIYEEMWAALLSGNTWRGEFCNRKKNGDEYWESVVMTPVRADDGTISHYIAIKDDITAEKHAQEELERLAITDPLTGLFNRRYFAERAKEILSGDIRNPSFSLGIIIADFDHFKLVNDEYGHEVGDMVLKSSAALFHKILRPTDILARYGGEEFTILLPRTSGENTCEIAERLRRGIEAMRIDLGNGKTLRVTLSIGVANATAETDNELKILLRHADQALYAAKNSGRNCCKVWTPELES